MTTPADTLTPPVPAHLTARGAATRGRIVEAAAELVYERGVAATSLDDIMTASRTSKSQLYHYFTDKDALICAVILRQTERVLDGQDPYLRDLDSMTGLRRWCAAILEIQQQRRGLGGCPVGSLASALSDSSEDARLLLADSFRRWEMALETGLRAMQHTGELQADADPADLAAAIMTALQGGLLLTQTTRATRHLQLSLNMALDHIAGHLHDPPPRVPQGKGHHHESTTTRHRPCLRARPEPPPCAPPWR